MQRRVGVLCVLVLALAGCVGTPFSAETSAPQAAVSLEDAGPFAQADGGAPGDAPDTFEDARVVPLAPLDGDLVPLQGDVEDWYAFEGAAGAELTIRLSGEGARFWLHAPSGGAAATGVESDGWVSLTLSESGAWRLRLVQSASPSSQASVMRPYSIHLSSYTERDHHAVSDVAAFVLPIAIPDVEVPMVKIRVTPLLTGDGGKGYLALALRPAGPSDPRAEAVWDAAPLTHTMEFEFWGSGTHHLVVVLLGEASHASYHLVRGGAYVGAPVLTTRSAGFLHRYGDLEGPASPIPLANAATGGSASVDAADRLFAGFVCGEDASSCVSPPSGAHPSILDPLGPYRALVGPAGSYRFTIPGEPGSSSEQVVLFGADVRLA